MNKRLSIAVPTALAAGVLLLSACGNGESPPAASGSTSDTPTSTSDIPATTATGPTTSTGSTGPSAADEELQPVDCGAVTLAGGAVHRLIAEPAANGLVGCTEAVNVIDEFGKLPPEQRSAASLGNVELPSGWSCTVDDGETANVSCVKDMVGDEYGFALRTEQQAA